MFGPDRHNVVSKILGTTHKDRWSHNKEKEYLVGGIHKGQSVVDKAGYYTGYCQCPCKECTEGSRHCQGLVCRGD
jgi:hypothetical protein